MQNREPEGQGFDKCPVCGSTKRFVAGLAEREGLDNPEMYGLNFAPGVIFGCTGEITSKKKMLSALIGSKVPVFAAFLDACANPECGAVYTVRQQVQYVPIRAVPQQPPGGGGRPPDVPGLDQLLKGPFGKS